jgi:ribosomal protein S18 acetylase RimI-like enzyme
MSQLDIRPVEDSDVEAVIALWKRCNLTMPYNDPYKDIAFARGGRASDVLVGLLDGNVAASVMVGHDGHRGAVYYVSVDPDLRGRGLGAEIMDAAENWLRDRGVWKLNLLIRDTNLPVKAFYESLGYDEEPRAAMAKWLTEKPA